jgi:hypothetical protein
MTKKVIGSICVIVTLIALTGVYVISNHREATRPTLDQVELNPHGEVIQTTSPDIEKVQEVPPMLEEDVITLFFTFINDKRIPEAVEMLSYSAVPDDSAKQAWGVQFNAFEKVTINKLEKQTNGQYKVSLNVQMKPESVDALIPYYGFENGDNIRWITLTKEAGLWKITEIATGP